MRSSSNPALWDGYRLGVGGHAVASVVSILLAYRNFAGSSALSLPRFSFSPVNTRQVRVRTTLHLQPTFAETCLIEVPTA